MLTLILTPIPSHPHPETISVSEKKVDDAIIKNPAKEIVERKILEGNKMGCERIS
jgi:hypothetical protein